MVEHFELCGRCQAEIGLVVEGRFCDGLDGIFFEPACK